jgi:hypothetical protein
LLGLGYDFIVSRLQNLLTLNDVGDSALCLGYTKAVAGCPCCGVGLLGFRGLLIDVSERVGDLLRIPPVLLWRRTESSVRRIYEREERQRIAAALDRNPCRQTRHPPLRNPLA